MEKLCTPSFYQRPDITDSRDASAKNAKLPRFSKHSRFSRRVKFWNLAQIVWFGRNSQFGLRLRLVRLGTSVELAFEGVLWMSSKIPLWECSLNVFVIVIVFVFAGLCRSAHGNLRFQESQLALGPVFKLPPKRIPGFQDLQKKQSLYCSYCIKTNNQQKITMITNTNSNKKKHVL